MNEVDGPKTLLGAIRYFEDEDVCHNALSAIRWPDGVIGCPSCGNTSHYFLKTRRVWKCKACAKQFSVKVGTVFEDSPLKLSKWLPAVWMICGAKNGVSSYEIARALGVTQKTAWFMLHRIREAMKAKAFEKQVVNVEAGDTSFDDRIDSRHSRVSKSKSAYRPLTVKAP